MRHPLRLILATCVVLASAAPRAAYSAPTVQQCLAASNASVKLRSSRRLRSARTELLVCVSPGCPSEIREECGKRMDRLNESFPTVVFGARDGAGHDLLQVKVTMDTSEVVAQRLDGSSIVLDPGPHTFTFEAEGQPTKSVELVLREGEKNVPVRALLATQLVPQAPPSPPRDTGHGRRSLGLIVGGVGVAGVALGGIFGALTLSKWSTAKGECLTGTQCSARAIDDRSTSLTFSAVADVGLIAGGALAATGLVLYLTAPAVAGPSSALRFQPGGLELLGSF